MHSNLKKWLVFTVCAVTLMCTACAMTNNVAPEAVAPDNIYPYVAPDDPAKVDALDSLLSSMAESGYEFLGMASDENGDTMVWVLNTETGLCEAYLVMFSQGGIIPIPDCDIAFDMWRGCVDMGGCRDDESVVERSNGV